MNSSSGHPWDNPVIMEGEIIPSTWVDLPSKAPEDKAEKVEISCKDFNLLVHYKKAYEEVEAYWRSYISNLWSLMMNRPRREREELLKEINLVEDFIMMLQDKRVK